MDEKKREEIDKLVCTGCYTVEYCNLRGKKYCSEFHKIISFIDKEKKEAVREFAKEFLEFNPFNKDRINKHKFN